MTKPCGYPDCERPYKAIGYCALHAQRVRHHGHPELQPHRTVCIVEGCESKVTAHSRCEPHREERLREKRIKGFFANVDRSGASDDCWGWSGAISTSNYTRVGREYGHRFSYELHVGPIPEGLVIDHLCMNTLCTNPRHLEPVTRLTNTLRGTHKIALVDQMDRCMRGHERSAHWYVSPASGRAWCRACARLRRQGGAA